MATTASFAAAAPGSGLLDKQRELKEKAVAFYSQCNVPATLEKLLNEMFFAAPPDVYGYMSEYFDKLSLEPVICRATCHEVLDGRGGKAIEVLIYCTVHGTERYITSTSVPLHALPPHPPPPPPSTTAPPTEQSKKTPEPVVETKQLAAQREEEDVVVGAFDSFDTYIVPELLSRPPNQQKEIDDRIVALKDAGGRKLHSSALLAASLAVAKSAAQLTHTSLHQYLTSSLLPPPHPPQLSLPLPVTSLLAGGCGKLKIREICLTPRPEKPFAEQVSLLCSMYHAIGALLAPKAGPNGAAVLPNGAYCMPIDNLDSALATVKDAAQSVGTSLDQDLAVIIDIGADQIYNEDKGKYELTTGQWKTTQEMIKLYSDLLDTHSGLLGYIDPLHHKDMEGWKNLQETLGNKCLLVADKTLAGLSIVTARNTELKRPSVERETDPEREGKNEEERKEDEEEGEWEVGEEGVGVNYLSCVGLHLETSLSETCFSACSLQGCAHYVMLCAPPTLTVNSLLADLVVALQCRFIRLAAPAGLTSTCLLSRLLQIEKELNSSGNYKQAKAHVFLSSPVIKKE